MTRKRRKRQNKLIIFLSVFLLFLFTIGYAAFSTNLNITAKGTIKGRNDLYVSSNGNDETGNGTIDKPYATINKAYDSAWNNATIWIMNDISVDETVLLDKEKNITKKSEEGEINSILRGETTEMLLNILNGEITLTNITFDGQNKEANYSLLRAYNCTINLNENTTFQNNIDNIDKGGAITLSFSIMNIDGAKIINNQALAGGGGGIIARHSTLTINNGEIKGNKAINGGAIFFGDLEGALTLNNGIITQNTTIGNYGGAIALAGANMIMNGGEITYNTAATVGGGIALTKVLNYDNLSTFTMKKGTISNNTATNGGGIYVYDGHTYTYINGTIIDNTPNNVFQNS